MDFWFTSDPHADHKNIIKYCERPFEDIHHMTEMLVQYHNELVKQGDVVFNLGDVAMNDESVRKYMRRLNGQTFLLKGNHDDIDTTTAKSFGWVKDYHEYKLDGVKLILFHYPLLTWNGQRRGAINLHGHTHQKEKTTLPGKKQIHVGVDSWNYRPVHWDEIKALADKQVDVAESFREDRK